MKFSEIGQKMDSFIDNKVIPKTKEIKESDFVNAKVKPNVKKMLGNSATLLNNLAEKIKQEEDE